MSQCKQSAMDRRQVQCSSAGFITALLSDKTQLSQLSKSYNSALELAQEAGLNLAAISSALAEAQTSKLTAQLSAQAELSQKLLKLPAGSSAVVTNGRAVVLHSPVLGLADEFSAEDFDLLVGWSTKDCFVHVGKSERHTKC